MNGSTTKKVEKDDKSGSQIVEKNDNQQQSSEDEGQDESDSDNAENDIQYQNNMNK